MKITELLKLVLLNTLQNKFKVLLTSLGIIVGTATIVLVMAIGEGAKFEAEKQYSGLSADTIYVNIDYKQLNGNFDYKKLEKLDEDLMNKIREENLYIKNICIRGQISKEMRVGKTKDYAQISGVTGEYLDVYSITVGNGASFDEADFDSGKKVAVIGFGLAEKFFGGSENAVGRRIKLGDISYTVIGIIARNGDGLQGVSHDDTVYIPYYTLMETEKNIDYMIPQISAKADNIKNVKSAIKQMQGTLNYYLDTPQTYEIEDAGSRIETATKSARTMSMLLTSVALIVLTVGGIGIMNVLFVTVKERTREIGVLKALGSKNSHILLQFLMESVFIGAAGGIAGLIVSAFALLVMPYTGLATKVNGSAFILAFFFAILTSAVFGFYPAYQASRLKPVDALSYE